MIKRTVPGGGTEVLVNQVRIIRIINRNGIKICFYPVQLGIDLLLIQNHSVLCVIVHMVQKEGGGFIIMEDDERKKK